MNEQAKVQTLFDAWRQNQDLTHALPSWSLIREAFETGWKARSLEPDIADIERVADSLLHTLIRRDPERAKVIITNMRRN